MNQHRETVYRRDWSRCVAAESGTCQGGLTLQHRVNRGMGGSSGVGDGPQWFVTMCAYHNGLLESSADAAARGRWAGWSLPHLRAPEVLARLVLKYPVLYGDGTWWFLDAEGLRIPCWDPVSAIARAEAGL